MRINSKALYNRMRLYRGVGIHSYIRSVRSNENENIEGLEDLCEERA